MNSQQLGCAQFATGRPLCILAGAGTGKTFTLVRRIEGMLEQNIDERTILAISFTNKAAAELEARCTVALGEKAQGVHFHTFHSFCSTILDEGSAKIEYIDDAQMKELVRQSLSIWCRRRGVESAPSSLAQVVSSIKAARELGQVPSDATTRDVYSIYSSLLQAQHKEDFGSTIASVATLWSANLNALEEARSRYKYGFVDEFQDTSPMQLRLLHLLFGESGQLTVVGDDDQSIYSWRWRAASIPQTNSNGRAHPHNDSTGCAGNRSFRELQNMFAPLHQLTTIKLEINYRSQPKVTL
jgi:DNA helicase-2/ATP-dependent DNA helicase PcrA